MGSKNSAEVASYIGGIFEAAFEDPEIGPKVVGTGLVVAFDFIEPEAVLVVDTANKSVHEGAAGEPEPAATMTIPADNGNGCRQGEVNPPLAMATRKVRIRGNVDLVV